jgi:hypothetical protein
MIDLIPELIEHVISYLELEECTPLLCIKSWDEIIAKRILALVDETLAKYDNQWEQLHKGSHRTKEICRRYDYEDDDSPYNTWNITTTTITQKYTLEITKHEKKMHPEEFETFVNMLGVDTPGYLYPYVVSAPGLIIQAQDPNELEQENGMISDEYCAENVIDWSIDDVENFEEAKKESFLKILELMGLLAVSVYSTEQGTKYQDSFSYQVLMLMPEGTSFTLTLSTSCSEDRYTLYNE